VYRKKESRETRTRRPSPSRSSFQPPVVEKQRNRDDRVLEQQAPLQHDRDGRVFGGALDTSRLETPPNEYCTETAFAAKGLKPHAVDLPHEVRVWDPQDTGRDARRPKFRSGFSGMPSPLEPADRIKADKTWRTVPLYTIQPGYDENRKYNKIEPLDDPEDVERAVRKIRTDGRLYKWGDAEYKLDSGWFVVWLVAAPLSNEQLGRVAVIAHYWAVKIWMVKGDAPVFVFDSYGHWTKAATDLLTVISETKMAGPVSYYFRRDVRVVVVVVVVVVESCHDPGLVWLGKRSIKLAFSLVVWAVPEQHHGRDGGAVAAPVVRVAQSAQAGPAGPGPVGDEP